MSFALFVGILLLSQLALTSQKNCVQIKPKSSSDCELSSDDKDKGYIYCCFEEYLGYKECKPLTQDDYDDEKEIADYLGDSATFVCSSTVLKNLSIKTLILLIFLNL